MKRWILALAFFGLAWAATPPVVKLYDAVLPRVLEAKRVLAKDPAQALVLVEEAEKAFAQGKDQLPEVIAAGIERAIKDARVSVARRSKADLEGRIWVLRGAFGKALYDAFFEAVARGDLESAKVLLDRLTEATARPEALKERAWELAQKGDIQGLRRLFERAYLEAIVKTLDLAKQSDDRVRAYALASKAYGLFLVIQDSPRVGELSARDFVATLQKLTSGDLAGFRADVERLEVAARAALETLKEKEPPPLKEPIKEPTASSAGMPPENHPAAPVAQKPKVQSASPRAPAIQASPRTSMQQATAPALEPPEVFQPRRRVEIETFHPPGWMPKDLADRVRARARALGYYYVQDYLDEITRVQREIGVAAAFLGLVRLDEMRAHVDRAWWRYEAKIAPIAELYSPITFRMERLMDRFRETPGVRTADLNTLYGLLEAQRNHFEQGPPSAVARLWLKLEASLLSFTGLPRAVFFLVVGVLSLFPLYLVKLTFGGRNIFWRLLGLAFFLLFLPAIAEAISYFGEIMAEYGGIPQLAGLINLSVLQSLPAQVAWGILVFLVVVVATWGLRGIAAQFGLLQGRTEEGSLQATATSESVIEWDEEF